MGIGKLRRFYNITIFLKAIPTKYINEDVCEVYVLLKIKKYRKRIAASDKLNLLELVSMDIYGLFFNEID